MIVGRGLTHDRAYLRRRAAPGAETEIPSPPDGESTPTLAPSAAGHAHRLENQHPRGRPLVAATREPACQDCAYDLMIDLMATGTVTRPPAHLPRPRGREAPSPHPPAPVNDTTSKSLEQRAENTSAPATLLPHRQAARLHALALTEVTMCGSRLAKAASDTHQGRRATERPAAVAHRRVARPIAMLRWDARPPL